MKKLVRNYDADYEVYSNGDVADKGRGVQKRYAIEVQDSSGDVVEWISADSEEEAMEIINNHNLNIKAYDND